MLKFQLLPSRTLCITAAATFLLLAAAGAAIAASGDVPSPRNGWVVAGIIGALVLLLIHLHILRCHLRKVAAQESLQATLDTLMSGCSEAAVIISNSGQVVALNSSASRMTGWSNSDAAGKPICDVVRIFCPDGRLSITEILYEVLTTGQPVENPSEHHVLVDQSGHEFNIAYRFSPAIRPGGKPCCTVLTFRDLNEHLALREQLRQAQKLESVGRLAGGIAHDFNNMIGAISGTAEVMMLQLSEDDGLMRYVRRIFATATKAADLTTRLLSFTRKGTSAIATSFSLNSIVKESIEIIERSMDPRVEVKTFPCEADNTIIGDPSGIENAIINLCLNANDAMPKGGRLTLTVSRVTLEENWCKDAYFQPQPGEFIRLAICDTGTGIGPEQIGHIFEPFFTTKEAGKGSGLGLAAVYGTMREHHGTLSVESTLNVGTTFHLYFPLAAGQAPERVLPEIGAPIRRGTGTVLLVDDEEFMRDAGKLMLESLGYSVLLASNGKDAVDCYRQQMNQIDVVILDMVMPRMNGSDAFKLIIEINPAARVIIASGFSRETGITGLFAKGLKAFIKKPYRQAEIAEILADILEEE